MKRIIQLIVLLLLTISIDGFGQIYRTDYINGTPYNFWYTVHEGTISFRQDGSGSPDFYTDSLYLGTFYGEDIGGAMTNWGNSGNYTSFGRNTGYIDLSLFRSGALATIDQPSDVEFLPRNPWGFNFWTSLNARMALPHEYLDNPSGTEKYPLVIMMHGVGETGTCRGNCLDDDDPRKYSNDHNVYHGGREHLDAINRNATSTQHWPGFVLFPQGSNGWGFYPSYNVHYVVRMIETLIRKYPIDPYRIYIHGLSNGGQGTYLLAYERPDLIAAMAPMSGTDVSGYAASYGYNGSIPTPYPIEESIVHVPIWQFQGENDTRPTPASTEFRIQQVIDAGGSVRYTKYANTGHNTWTRAYREPDFFSWFLQNSKLKIHSYYGINFICEGSVQRLGVTGGFLDYEWEQSTDGGSNWSPYTAITGRPHEIDATEAGLYRVRIQRDAGDGITPDPEWSQWSEPFDLIHRDRPKPEITTNGSWVLFGLNNNTSLTLTADKTDAENYVWYRNGVQYATGDNLFSITLNATGEGVYTVQYDDNFCTSLISDPIYVNREPTGGGEPAAPSNLQSISTSTSTTTSWWQDNATDEIGYEIYRSLDGGNNYTWLGNYEENKITFEDSGLPAGQSIFYKIRAFNENGASDEATVEVVMPADNTPPTIPTNFSFARFGIEEIRMNPRPFPRSDEPVTMYDETYRVHLDSAVFTWNPVVDGTAITYDLYNGNNVLIGSTQDTSYVVPGLAENESYSFYVKARDINNLESGKSQTASVFTALNGLYYYYYQGAIWDVIAEYSFHPASDQGPIDNFSINSIPEHDFPDYFAYDFFGEIRIDQAGTYDFRTNSDDGSSLWIGNTMVVDNDGLHGSRNASGSYNFPAPGNYPITVKFFERTGGNSLSVSWRPPGQGNWSSIPNSFLTTTTATPPELPDNPTNLVATANTYDIDLSWDHPMDQVHVVVLGSSTAAGVGATAGNSWVEKFTAALTGISGPNSISNLALNGYTTYNLLPTGTSTPGNRPNPDPGRNITAAIAQSPDIIIVNLPSNDRAGDFDLENETMDNFQTIKSAADAAGIPIYFTTTQPRNFPDQSDRDLLETEKDRIIQDFSSYAINIYDELADANGNIKAQYNSDGVHVNDAGHDYIFQTIWNKVNTQSIPYFEVFRSENGGAYQIAITTNQQQVAITDPDLKADTQYNYRVRASTSAGVSSFSNTDGATTAGDLEPPTIPQNFSNIAVTETQITVVWEASTDNVSVDHYVVEEVTGGAGGKTENIVLGTTSNTGLTVTGLTPLETYDLIVYAVDPSGNRSANSNGITVQTQSPLPVEFLDVSHRITDEGVLVTWATASELNNAFFTIERGTGLNDFKPIGGVEGSGTTYSRHDYVFLDDEPLDLAYYRIKQTDFDGKFDYSRIIRVVYNQENLEEFTVYPNPTNQNNINARGFVPTDRPSVQVQLLDVMGKVHMVKAVDPNSFLNGLKIDLEYQVPPGVYIIQISDGASNTQRRVVIR